VNALADLSMAQAEILVIGEALVDVIARADRPPESFPGGSPLNVAVGLRRLGLQVRLHSSFGSDSFGELIATHLTANGVEVTTGTRISGPTSRAEAAISADGSATYSFRVRWDPPPSSVPAAGLLAVHTGSIAAVLEPGASVVEAEVDRLRRVATISYDPNVRPQLMPDRVAARERIERMIAKADVVKVSDEDIAWLHPGSDPACLARSWLEGGPAIVVITRGGEGAHAFTWGGETEVAAPQTPVADTVGAGDSFMSGLLAGLADNGLLGRTHEPLLRSIDLDTTRSVLDFAARCAAVTVSRHGADPPARDELAGCDASTF
jgi:fructokinase